MSSFLEAEEQREAPAANQWCWQRLSPNHLDHRQRVPTAITLHRLVPHPPPSLRQADNTTTSRSTFKYITPEDIKAAQIKARQEILASKQVSLAPPPPPPSSDTRAPPLSKNKKQSHKKESPGSRPFFPCRLDNGETGLRRRQLTRLLSQISQTLGDLQDLKDSRRKDFVTPLDLEIKRQRWTECVRSLRRSLFALKQEVVTLEGKRDHGKRNSRYLRALAATARTLNIQLMALKSQAKSSGGELPWTEVFREFLGVAHRVLVLAASVGVQPPPSSLKWTRSPQKGASLAPDDSSGLESTLSILDAGPTSVPLLQSKHVRNRLASLAALHLKRKKKEGDDKATNWTSANKISNPYPKPSAPKTSFQAFQSLRTSPPGKPNPSPLQTNISTSPQPTSFQTENSAIDPQPSPSQTNISAIQPEPSPSQDNISSPQCQLPPPQNDNTEVPHPLSSSHERNNLMPQTSPLAPDLTQQLSFLLEKVCRIEDNRRRTEALISEAPQICQSQSVTPSLACAVQRAKLALATVTGSAPYSQVPLPKNEGSYTPGNPLFRGTGLSPKHSKEGLVRTSSHPAIQDHSTEAIEETANQFGIKWLAGDSVTDQVRRQKEKFWLSLAERGYVRPLETLPLNEEEASVKGTINNASAERGRDEFVRTLKKTGVHIEPSQKNAASRAELYQQTSKSLTKQTQCSNSSGSSYSSNLSSNDNSRTQQSPPEKHSKPSITAANKTKSHSSEEQIQQSMCVDSNTSSRTVSTTESHTFPSYEGISSHE